MAGYLFNPAQITFGSTSGTVAQGNDPRIVGAAQSASSVQAVSSATTLATASLPKVALCSGSSYPLTLAAASACANQTQRIVIDAGLTGLVTLTAAGSDTIDGQATRILWAGESVNLYSDGTSWRRSGGQFRGMAASFQRNAAQAYTNANYAKCLLDTQLWNYGGMNDLANSRIRVVRAGRYSITVFCRFETGNTTPVDLLSACWVNGAEAFRYELTISSPQNPSTTQVLDLSANAYVELYIYQASGGTLNTATNFPPRLTVVELP